MATSTGTLGVEGALPGGLDEDVNRLRFSLAEDRTQANDREELEHAAQEVDVSPLRLLAIRFLAQPDASKGVLDAALDELRRADVGLLLIHADAQDPALPLPQELAR